MRTDQTGTVAMSLRLPADLAAALTSVADANERSRNAEIVHMLKRHLAETERFAGPAEPVPGLTVRGTADVPFRRDNPNTPSHPFKAQKANAHCGTCGRLRHQHGEQW